jgi:EAL domain-containing protein (putative c-di-GMP-specific phosphodiesterase class I)
MRIQLSDQEIIPAGVFMPMAQRLNQTLALDKLVIKNIINIIQRTKQDQLFFVNISPLFLESEEDKQWILDQLKTIKDKAHRFIIELPEYGVVSRLPQTRSFFQKLVALGAKTSIDHYGKNFSSFSYLYNLKVHYLKIDGGFIKDLEQSQSNQFFVRSLVDIAHSLDILVIAEAVETAEEYAILQTLKVDGVQGYFVHKPSDMTDLK